VENGVCIERGGVDVVHEHADGAGAGGLDSAADEDKLERNEWVDVSEGRADLRVVSRERKKRYSTGALCLVAPGFLHAKAVSDGFSTILPGPHALHKWRKGFKKIISHVYVFRISNRMDGYSNTHTHAWVYKCISVITIR
jgi:hypothetical protein